ncbi:D-aminoacyl-tRNA deacylase [Mesorhizobium sp. DCY119]|uniref:D-aminoacyl-tRNA deacylase n=1 Tax=Mesorhizobium sp. DCY119 TaxID=2108445 RepID=UPI001FDFC8CB|nr:D-aminoacyl-tRNA deacylase [Mesorhizobium sp. DCY119]
MAAETKGNRPGFSTAAPPEQGQRLYEEFADKVLVHGISVAKGVFGADMRAGGVDQ